MAPLEKAPWAMFEVLNTTNAGLPFYIRKTVELREVVKMSAMERKVEEFGVTQKRILLFVLALVAFLVVEQNTGRIIDATKLNLKFNEIDLREDIPEDTVYHHKNKQRPSVSSSGATGELKVT
jgi:hypothetical protein